MKKQTKISYLLIFLAIVSSVLHNLISAWLGTEEVVFFFLTLVLAAAFAISIIYNTYTHKTQGEPKDLWKLGWLGLLGLVGFMPRFGPDFFGLYGFFGFFGFKNKDTRS